MKHRTRWLPALLLVAGFLAGLLAGGVARPDVTGELERPSQPRPVPSRAGAISAARSFLMALRWDVIIEARKRRAALAKHVTPAAARLLERELEVAAEPVRAAVTVPPVVARRAILGHRVIDFQPGRATVAIWGLALFATGAYGPVSQWSTSRVTLEWHEGRWLVTDVRSDGGPSPSSSLRRLAEADRSFEEAASGR